MTSKHHQALNISAQFALYELQKYLSDEESAPWALSVLEKLELIIIHARDGIDPVEKLEDRSFSFGVATSHQTS